MRRNKRGITPIIAVILLLMMTVAGAGAAFFWFIRIQSETQGGTESYSEILNERVSAKIGVLSVDYTQVGWINASDGQDNLTLILQNQGNVNVPFTTGSTAPTTTFSLADSDQNMICQSSIGNAAGSAVYCAEGCNRLDVRETQKIVLTFGNSSTTQERRCTIGDYSTYVNDSIYYFKLDFSGVTATGGQFVK